VIANDTKRFVGTNASKNVLASVGDIAEAAVHGLRRADDAGAVILGDGLHSKTHACDIRQITAESGHCLAHMKASLQGEE
jgi:hypothetical protein